MNTDAIAGSESLDIGTDALNDASDFMTQREGQGMDPRFAGTIMGVGVADTGGLDLDQHVASAWDRFGDFARFERVTWTDQTD
jgi:hypothetical protein